MRAWSEQLTAILGRIATPRHAAALMVGMVALLLHLMTKSDLLAVAIIAPVLVLLLPIPDGAAPAALVEAGRLPGQAVLETYLDRRFSTDISVRPAILALQPSPLDADDRAPTRGDLLAAADAMRTVLRSDDMIAADGEGNLLVTLSARKDAEEVQLIQVALRLQKRLRAPCVTADGTIAFSTAIGIGPSDSGAARNGAQFCLLEAKRALRHAILRGTGEIALPDDRDPAMAGDAVRLAQDLDMALRDGQIFPYYQPQICTDTGRLIGVEALARWHHPQLGLVPPGKFLPTIDAAGAHRALTDTMLRHSVAQLAAWDRSDLDVPCISINVTHDDLDDPDFVQKVVDATEGAAITPDRLGIEVLETVLSGAFGDRIETTLRDLHDLGCQIDLDDFGTGQSSIASIRRFSVDRLKIDRSFIRNVATEADQQSMVAAIVTMAEQLKIEVLAEGVETSAEHARAAELGCGSVQGYAISRPIPGDDLPGWVEEWRDTIDTLDAPWSVAAGATAPPEGSPRDRRRGPGETA